MNEIVSASALKEDVIGLLVGRVAVLRSSCPVAAVAVLKSGEIRAEGFLSAVNALRWCDERNGTLTVYSDVCGLLWRWRDSPVWMKSPGFVQSLQAVR